MGEFGKDCLRGYSVWHNLARPLSLNVVRRRRLSFEDALQQKWSVAMASAILAVRSSGVRRRVHGTPHSLPLASVMFSRGRGGVVTVDLGGSSVTHK